jgi:hypothetical protein
MNENVLLAITIASVIYALHLTFKNAAYASQYKKVVKDVKQLEEIMGIYNALARGNVRIFESIHEGKSVQGVDIDPTTIEGMKELASIGLAGAMDTQKKILTVATNDKE